MNIYSDVGVTWRNVPNSECRPFLKNLFKFCRLVTLGWDPSEQEIIEQFSKALLLIKRYILADAVEFFLVQDEVIRRIDNVEENKPIKGNVVYEIGKQEVIAAHTAKYLETITAYGSVINKKIKTSKFPKGIGRGVRVPDHVASIPVISGNGDCLAVFEFYRIKNLLFKNVEILFAKCLVGWLGRSVRKRPLQELSENTAFRTWTKDFRKFQSGGEMILEHFISRALRTLQTKTEAGIVNFYKVEDGKYHIYGQVTPGVFMEKNREFLVETNPFFYTVISKFKSIKVDEKDIGKFLRLEQAHLKENLVQPIRNYLCVPIGVPSTVVGIIELLNKSGKNFNENDIEFAIHCGRFCCSATLLDKMNIQKTQAFEMAKSQTKTIMNNIAPSPYRFDCFHQKLGEMQVPENFYQFDFYPSLEQLKYCEQFCYFIFQEVFNLEDPHCILSSRFVDFIITMEKGYRENPFHNFEHGYNVCHTMFLITRNNKKHFTNLEIQALIVASLGHDIDHPGTTNKWVLHSQNPLSQCYENSYLENHHSNLCRLIVQNTGIFSDLKAEDFKTVMDFIHKLILATDIHGIECRFRISDLLDKNEFSINKKVHREYLFGLMMIGADVGGQAKKFDVNFHLCQNLYKEFHAERNKCLEIGYDPPWLRHIAEGPKNLPQLQINFNNEHCIPCFKLLSTILQGLTPLHKNCSEINYVWESIKKQGISWTEFTEEKDNEIGDT